MLGKILFILLTPVLPSFAQNMEPCALSDYQCISYVLSSYSDCNTMVWGSVPNEIQYNNQEYEVPNFNGTIVDQYSVVKNLDNCYVSAFFVNDKANAVVLAIDCPNIQINAHRRFVQHQDMEEDQFYSYKLQQKFPLISMTANFRPKNYIDLCNAFVFSYVSALPEITVQIDDKNTQPLADVLQKQLVTQLNVFVREQFRYKGQNLFRQYINYMLCDFEDLCREDDDD